MSPSETKKDGEIWQYETLRLSNDNVTVYPPPPRNPRYVIFPSWTAIKEVPSGAPISIPLW